MVAGCNLQESANAAGQVRQRYVLLDCLCKAAAAAAAARVGRASTSAKVEAGAGPRLGGLVISHVTM
jgi:hypothetical protein